MGVIDITPRRVSLGNLPGVRQVNTDTGAGLRSAAGAQLGRAVAGFGMELNRTANALEERRQRNAAWDYINKFQAAMRADDEEAAKTGIADGEDPEKWVEGRIKRRGEIESRVAKETGIDKKSLALAERHLAGFNLSTQSKWAARALSVTKGRELNAAKLAVDNAGTALLDAMDSEDEGARMAALASWDEALANLAGQDETLGKEGIDALRRTKTEELLRSSLARKLETLTAISETQGPKEVEQTFHDFLQKFADDGTKALVNGTFKGADGFEDDLVERDLRGMDEKAFNLAARRDIEAARQKAVARAERRDVEEVEAVLNEGVVAASTVRNADDNGNPVDRVQAIENVITRVETLARTKPKGSQAAARAAAGVDHLDKLADQVASEEIMDEYLEMLRRDPQARIFDAKGEGKGKYNAYKGQGRKERLAENVQKVVDTERANAAKESRQQVAEFRKANENELKGRMARLMFLEADGDITPNEAAMEQADIWRKLGLYTVAESITPDFALNFRTSFLKRVDEQEKAAVLDLYREFGYNGETGANGLAPASVQKKDDTSYYVPQAEGADEDDRIKVKASEMYDYVQQMLHTLRALPPDVDRKEATKAVVKECKTNWIKSGWFDSSIEQNKQSGMRAIMDYQREAQTARAVRDAGKTKEDRATEEE